MWRFSRLHASYSGCANPDGYDESSAYAATGTAANPSSHSYTDTQRCAMVSDSFLQSGQWQLRHSDNKYQRNGD